ncbi:MAG: glycosyltransferase [Phycisphaeraceae bacterium]|nr:glycosyltransferase [Phycisphaeraceae bacterium]
MNIAVIVEYVRDLPWAPSRWATDAAEGLRRRGHRVVMVCDGADDGARLAAGVDEAYVRRPARRVRDRRPLAFARWARRQLHAIEVDATISCSSLVEGSIELWSGMSALGELGQIVRERSAASVFLELAHHRGLLSAVMGERRVRRRAKGEKVGAWGASRLEATDVDDVLRNRVRGALGINVDERVFLIGATHRHRPGIREMLAGLGMFQRGGGGGVAIVIGRETYSLSAMAGSAGAQVRCLGAMRDMAAVLAAADVVVAAGDASGEGGTGRFVADALHVGRPVLCDAGASGAELLESVNSQGEAPGAWVSKRTAGAWCEAFVELMEAGTYARAQRAAQRLRGTLSMDAWISRLEESLAARASR